MAAAAGDGDDAAAFQRLYPDQHYDRFLDSGVRPDGRTVDLPREVTIGLGAVSSAASSALVKVCTSPSQPAPTLCPRLAASSTPL